MDLSGLTLNIPEPKQVGSTWTRKDRLGALRVRFSIGRSRYRIDPGLYRLGSPGKGSEVIVTANYKLSFDHVRRSLDGWDVWILVLETYGINVWCAAGKGTFGTSELVRRIEETRLDLYVDHKRIIVPQLGAPGISGHKVKEATGYQVKFGPVRSEDLPKYLESGFRKDEQMRLVKFGILDRLILAPVEVMNSLKYLLIAILALVLLSGINSRGYSLNELKTEGVFLGILVVASYLAGALAAPVLLPWLPFRQFSGKGLVLGILVAGIFALSGTFNAPGLAIPGIFLLSGAIASFLTMNFTGASTYTSLSGVNKEMRLFVPIQLGMALLGLTGIVLSQVM